MAHTTLPENIQRRLQNWRWVDAIHRWRAAQVLRKSQIHRYLPKTGLMLDLGAGSGHIAEAIIKDAPGRSCVMMDPVSSIFPHVARRLTPFSSLAMKGDGTRLPFPGSTFNAAWSSFMLHHVTVDGQRRILDEVVRVLRPQATFVLLEDTPSNAQEFENTLRADRRLNFEPEEAPHHYRSPDEWRRDLPQHGLLIDREIAFSRVLPPATLRAVHHRAFVCHRR
jgi:ubiquinone/menaquinone biosynthesis C-methylase UbiE